MIWKLLPLFALAAWIYWLMTAQSRMQRWLERRSEPLGDWSLREPILQFSRTLETKPFEVRVLDMDAVNGVATPDGSIYISRGLYEKYLSGAVSRDEVAAVIAHEIGHVALGHHSRRIAALRIETATLAALGAILGRALFGIYGLIAVLGLGLLRGRLTQKDEFEADAFSAQLMMRAGLDANAIITLLDKLKTWTGDGAALGPMRWLMSHPPISERIAGAKSVIAAGLGDLERT